MPPAAHRSAVGRGALYILGTLVIVFTGLGLLTRSRLVRLADAHPPSGNLAVVSGVRLHYVLAGSGPPVLLIHGSPGFLQDWQLTLPGKTSVFDDLKRDHTVIAVDRPGYGWSALPNGQPAPLEQQADLITSLLRTLHLDRVTIAGHSYGGSLALALAVHHPHIVENIVLVGPAIYPEGIRAEPAIRLQTWPAVGPFFRWCINPLILRPMVRASVANFFKPDAPPPGYADLFATFLQKPAALSQMGTELVDLHADLAAQSPRYGDITVPVTVIYGELDVPEIREAVPRLAEAVPHTRVVKLNGIGHEVQHLRPHVVTAEVRRLTYAAAVPAPAPAE